MRITRREKDPKVRAILDSVRKSSAPIRTSIIDVQSMMDRNDELERDNKRREENYALRELKLKGKIEDLEDDINNERMTTSEWMKTDSKMAKLKYVQGKIGENVNSVQEKTSNILQEQERDLMRSFRARLFDGQDTEKAHKSHDRDKHNKKDVGASHWKERSRQLEVEVEWAKEVHARLERVNHALELEQGRLKGQYQLQHAGRRELEKELADAKIDNELLLADFLNLENENRTLQLQKKQMEEALKVITAPRNGPLTSSSSSALSKDVPAPVVGKISDAESKCKELNVRWRRVLVEERKLLAIEHENYEIELRTRREMEMLLRQCLDDVQKEISKKHIEAAHTGDEHGDTTSGDLARLYSVGSIPIADYLHDDRERALELLLSQERVVKLLYSKVFPVNDRTTGSCNNEKDEGVNECSSRLTMNDRPHSSGFGSASALSMSNMNTSSDQPLPSIHSKSGTH